jgi:hypothetical protein
MKMLNCKYNNALNKAIKKRNMHKLVKATIIQTRGCFCKKAHVSPTAENNCEWKQEWKWR